MTQKGKNINYSDPIHMGQGSNKRIWIQTVIYRTQAKEELKHRIQSKNIKKPELKAG